MSLQECMNVAYNAGFRGDQLDTIVAIAGGESGWNSQAIAKDDGGPGYPSVGYFQINTSAHYDKLKGATLDEKINNLLNDPQYQADMAYTISGGGANFNPWTIYKNGSYAGYYDQVKAVVPNNDASTGSSTGNGSANQTRGETEESKRQQDILVNFVKAQVGKPYVWGGGRDGDTDNFDCSGLTWAAYQQIGMDVGGDAWVQSTNGTEPAQPYSAFLQPGDLVFFRGVFPWNGGQNTGDGPEHVGMYIGGGQQVDARTANAPLDQQIVQRDVPWESVVGARRYIATGTTANDGSGFNLPSLPSIPGVDSLGKIADVIGKVGEYLLDPLRMIQMVLGGGLVLIGIIMMASSTKVGQTAMHVGMTAATKGAL